MDEAKSLVGAEAASVFLVDREQQELYSTVNSTGEELRIPIKSGVAGHVAHTGMPLIIQDAYADTRFNTAIDTKTGFKTRNILCVPVRGGMQAGIIGVAQLVNKVDSGVLAVRDGSNHTGTEKLDFTIADMQFLQVLAAQGGSAVVNSGMFSQMPSSPQGASRWLSRSSVLAMRDSPLPATSSTLAPTPDAGASEASVGAHAGVDHATRILIKPLLAAAFSNWEMDTLSLAELTGNKPLSVLAESLRRAWIDARVFFGSR
jgi:hypothetical protein